jgi:hypothetical protein
MWDFSNAFCTMSHSAIIDIAKRFGFCDQMELLLKKFLDQSQSMVKMSDVNGQYMSNSFDTKRGCQQGQIGSDFIFSMINDQILPRAIETEFLHRTKYVDDFADIISSSSYNILTKSLHENCDLLLKQSTSVGLKLNADKTQIMALNLTQLEIDELDHDITNDPKYLGFKIGFKGKNRRLSGNPGACALINQLNAAVRTISSLRKVNKSLFSRLEAATSLVWSIINNLALVYIYADTTHWTKVCVAIRKVLKSAGLDRQAPSIDLYRVTLKLNPTQIAIKQIIVLGLKTLDINKIIASRYNFYDPDSNSKPFLYHFSKQFQLLGKEKRKKLIDLFLGNPDPKISLVKVKGHLKSMFLKINNSDKKYDKVALNKLIFQMRYRIPKISSKIDSPDISFKDDTHNTINDAAAEIFTLGTKHKCMHRKTVRRK